MGEKNPQFAPVRVMLVDDSAVVRGLLTNLLDPYPDITVVASAANGEMALQTLKRQPVDVILLDVEMPVMDGLTALPKLREASPASKIIMVSSLTAHGAEASIQALARGAVDTLAKPAAREDKTHLKEFERQLIDKIRTAAQHIVRTPMPNSESVPAGAAAVQALANIPGAKTSSHPSVSAIMAPLPAQPMHAIAVASSTGGPQALLHVFGALKNHAKHVPIFITQHMPPTFTRILAEHLAKVADRPCAEAKHGEPVRPGMIYLAPGDYHMRLQRQANQVVVTLDQEPPINFCRPAADPMFQSIAEIYGRHTFAVVLTGMGSDGTEGARAITDAGGWVVAQDEASSVVYGMPKAVADAKLARAILPLEEVAPYVIRVMERVI